MTDIEVRDGVIVSVGDVSDAPTVVDLSGRWIVPAFIDSHVHLALFPVAEHLARGGVAAAVDLASPRRDLSAEPRAIEVAKSGPMITAVRGYPTQSWGRDGYGIECADAACATETVDRLVAAGAAVIKVPVDGQRALGDAALDAIARRAHAANIPVAAHALGDRDALRAARFDILAHTPLEPLSQQTVAAWSHKTVISTLSAFGIPTAVDNLRRLRQAGATVLYGTDLGNTRVLGISAIEIELLMAAGMNGADIIRAATADPARVWRLDGLGSIAEGKRASFLVLDRDPLLDPLALAEPAAVYMRGRAL